MISSMISRLIILIFGTLYPAYASYKAVKSKSAKQYVHWMMYWIVFALFTCAETITDIFLAWFPFYYKIKILILMWILSPVTKGSSVLYRTFIHPILTSKEKEIDGYISKAKEKSYKQLLDLGSKGVNVFVQTALERLHRVTLRISAGDNTQGSKSRPGNLDIALSDDETYRCEDLNLRWFDKPLKTGRLSEPLKNERLIESLKAKGKRKNRLGVDNINLEETD